MIKFKRERFKCKKLGRKFYFTFFSLKETVDISKQMKNCATYMYNCLYFLKLQQKIIHVFLTIFNFILLKLLQSEKLGLKVWSGFMGVWETSN